MSFWVYLLRCADGSFYAGHTDDLQRRLAEHEHGTAHGYTCRRRPVELVYSQDLPSREDALAAERQIKRWSRRKKEALIKHDWHALHAAAKKTFERD
ncbi:GIY-YIG nuclease family protein [Solimonas terrae]|uniref:GIY-YIG nuclease family protein n=1 Tax=Solimonas terrae TaxID=1396819 RepID=A0A6M2BQ90_9GAMM|nr:GIY-YIG nuclease family protein [Solimonas terrae]